MTAADFRRLALAISGAREGEHRGHPDFRLGGRIFASLDSPDVGWAMVKLAPTQQAAQLRDAAAGFRPANGAWGAQGYTIIFLADAKENQVRVALDLAARNLDTEKSASTVKRRR